MYSTVSTVGQLVADDSRKFCFAVIGGSSSTPTCHDNKEVHDNCDTLGRIKNQCPAGFAFQAFYSAATRAECETYGRQMNAKGFDFRTNGNQVNSCRIYSSVGESALLTGDNSRIFCYL